MKAINLDRLQSKEFQDFFRDGIWAACELALNTRWDSLDTPKESMVINP